REDGAEGRDAHARAPSRRKARTQRRDDDRVSSTGEDSVHGGLQRAGAGPAGQSVDCDPGAEHRAAAAGFRSARDGARAEPGSADDEGGSAGAREAGELTGEFDMRVLRNLATWPALVLAGAVMLGAPLVA